MRSDFSLNTLDLTADFLIACWLFSSLNNTGTVTADFLRSFFFGLKSCERRELRLCLRFFNNPYFMEPESPAEGRCTFKAAHQFHFYLPLKWLICC